MKYPERYRVAGEHGGDGQFIIPRGNNPLCVQASTGAGWDHVSVTLKLDVCCPTWEAMEQVRALFFDDSHWVLHYSPPRSKVVNVHPFCLHLWRPQAGTVPVPPRWMV